MDRVIWQAARARMLLASLVLGACAGEQSPAALSHWQVDSAPLVVIGREEGEAPYELGVANSAVRLADGRIVVANSGTSELRFFDSTGRALESRGREGDGPGEYRGIMAVYPRSGDSLVVYANGQQRFSVLDDSGTYQGTMDLASSPATPFPWDDWLVASTWVRGVRDRALRPCVEAVLAGVVPADSAPVRRAVVDDQHAIWMQPAVSPSLRARWTVYPLAGGRPVIVSLPAGVELYQAGADFVLGRRLSEEGVEQIVMYRLAGRKPGAPAACHQRATAVPAPAVSAAPEQSEAMKAELRNLIVSQEMYFAMHGTYAGEVDSTGWKSQAGNRVYLLRADRAGWFGLMKGPGADAPVCLAGVGRVLPPGWDDGAARCEQPRLGASTGSSR
jgi:hypothetical protein